MARRRALWQKTAMVQLHPPTCRAYSSRIRLGKLAVAELFRAIKQAQHLICCPVVIGSSPHIRRREIACHLSDEILLVNRHSRQQSDQHVLQRYDAGAQPQQLGMGQHRSIRQPIVRYPLWLADGAALVFPPGESSASLQCAF